MASLFGKLVRLAQTPQGRRAIDTASRRAQELARDPATRAKVEKLRRDLVNRRQSGRR